MQLGPTTAISPSSSAHVFTLPVQADDILILASDGLSDNLWDEDILDEVVRFRNGYLTPPPSTSSSTSAHSREEASSRTTTGSVTEASSIPPSHAAQTQSTPVEITTAADRIRWRRALAGMLSEALCSRARRVSERRHTGSATGVDEDEVPFARRAREQGRTFRGGKNDG